MIGTSYIPQKFQELSQRGTFRWETTDHGVPEVRFTPTDPTDRDATFQAEMFIDNALGGELQRFATAARALRQADADPSAGPSGPDRDARKGRVEVVGERNENWDGAIRSSSGGQFRGLMKFAADAASHPLTEAFGLTGVREMKTQVGFHHFPGYSSEALELIQNSPDQICIQVNTSGPEGPGAESHVYRIGPGGFLRLEEHS